VAIPHGRIKGLKDAVTGVVTLAQPVAFDAPDALPVKLLVFLLVPEQATQQHLELLSELAELLSDKAIRETLKAASTAADVARIIQEWQPENRQS
jgi:PTS system nitrogen regulatory IIA component